MRFARPSVAEERWLALASRHALTRDLIRATGKGGNWHCATLLTRCLFFALGLFAAGFAYSICDLLQAPAPGILAGLALIATAEWLITRRRMHASGIEEILWAAAAVMIVFELADAFGGLADWQVMLLCAATLLLAAWRLLNPLFTALAALLGSCAIATITGGFLYGNRAALAAQFCFALAFLMLAAGARHYQRPAFDRMLDWLVIALPAFGYGWTLWDRDGALTVAALRDGNLSQAVPALLLLAFGLAALFTGIRRRTHVPLIAALLCGVLLAVELRNVTGLPLEWRLICWGGIALFGSIALERWLRVPRSGITSRDLHENTTALDLLQMGGAAAVLPAATHDASPGHRTPPATAGGGGEFGGGGASGRY